MASRKYFISLLSLSGLGRISHGMPQCSKALVDQGFRPGVFIGDASGSVPVGQQVFLCIRSPAFEVVCFLPRSPCLDTDRLMSCTAVKDFPKGAAQFCMCCFLCVPTVGEAVARTSYEQSNSSCRRTWSFWTRSSSSATSEATVQTSPFSRRLRRFRTPPPKCPVLVLSSGSC